MNSTTPFASTPDLVAAVSRDLTPTERRIAEAVVAEPTLLAFGTVSDLAGMVGTSRPSIVRFANKLGFDGYTELQKHVRDNLSRRLSSPRDRIRSDHDQDVPVSIAIDNAIASVFDALDGDRLAELVEPIAHAQSVWIISGEHSQAGANALRFGLNMVRPGVRKLDERSFRAEIADAKRGDAAVVIDFLRYQRQVATAAEILAGAGVKIVAVTDSPLSPLVELADTWCKIKVPAVGPFDSSIPVVALCELLVAEVARELRDDATDRIDQIESLWDQSGAFL